ncbi:tandem-95 repeat protein, partial [Oceanisphaera psychrotolerans]|uniref:tandem-95 repeat protein n=1 Tax=Oceanisphaera psychrotolerans TaxID=1414654 RepID=UPI000A92CB01
EDTTKVLGADDFGSFADVDGDSLAGVQITSLETAGSLEYFDGSDWVAVTLNQAISKADLDAGYLRFVPGENESGNDYSEIGFKVSDGTVYSDSSYTLTVNVDAANDAPVAQADTASTKEDIPVTIDVLANDSDIDGPALSIKSATVPAEQGTVSIVDGKLVFTPAANFNGEATISYVATDGSLDTALTSVTVTVTPVADPVTVSSPVVNEASPYAVFTVKGVAGERVELVLGGGSAAGAGIDYGAIGGNNLEVSADGGASWTPYSSAAMLPASGALLVRTPVIDDAIKDNNKTFNLMATPQGGSSVTATATLKDDGSGVIFNADGSINATARRDNDATTPPVTPAAPSRAAVPAPAAGTGVTSTAPVSQVAAEPKVTFSDTSYEPLSGVLMVQRDIPEQNFSSSGGLTTISFIIPADTFGHTQPGVDIQLSAVLVNGQSLPDWLLFDAEKGEFRGVAPANFDGVMVIKVIARDENGRQVETQVTIRVRADANSDTTAQTGKIGLMDQLKSQSQFAWKGERDRLIELARQAVNTGAEGDV